MCAFYTEMMTVLTDIEAIINSHPLSYVSDDIRDGRIITPALLTIGRDLGSPPDAPPRKAEVSLSEHFRYQQRLQSHFWSHWLVNICDLFNGSKAFFIRLVSV